MTRHLQKLLLPALLLAAACPLVSLDWPVPNGAITETFGQDDGDHFNNGIDIDGESQGVHPVLAGELVFRFDEGQDYTSIPRGTGSFVVVHHGQDILSVYGNLAAGSLGTVRPSYGPTDRVGVVGDTGRAEFRRLHFAVFDEETGAWLNPFTFLPPMRDSQPPVIRRVLLQVGDRLQPLDNGVVVSPGTVEILVEAYDLREDVRFHWPLAPYSVSFTLDGKEVARTVFDSLQVGEGRMRVEPSGLSLDTVYSPDGLVRCGGVQLRSGESHLRVTARDFAGNEAAREIAFTVRQ